MEFGIKNEKITKSLLRATIKKALADIQRDPKRSVRNLVDLGLNFAEGCNQREIFDITQHYLSNENSAYYKLAEQIVNEADHEKLTTFGINFGYNGCTSGAKLLREKEVELGCHIPFMLNFILENDGILTVDDIENKIHEGMELGIYIYSVVCSSDNLTDLLDMTAQFSECAFVLFINPKKLTREALSRIIELNNVVISLHYDGKTDECINAVKQLREHGCVAVVHFEYLPENMNAVLTNAITESIAEMGAIAGVLYTNPLSDNKAQQLVSDYRVEVVRSQQYPLFIFEAKSDIERIEHMFSNAECLVTFAGNGDIYYTSQLKILKSIDAKRTALVDILKQLKY